jgi:hypothetical protein
MKYYLLSDKFSTNDAQFFAAADHTGTSIIERLERNELDVPFVYLELRHQNWQLSDKPPSSTSELILRNRVANVIRGSCKIDPTVKSYPAVFYYRSIENIVSREYECWIPRTMNDVLDRRKAIAKYYNEQILHVERWVLSAERIPPFDLFFTLPNQWIVTGRFQNVCVEFGVSGIGFQDVEVAV